MYLNLKKCLVYSGSLLMQYQVKTYNAFLLDLAPNEGIFSTKIIGYKPNIPFIVYLGTLDVFFKVFCLI